MMLRSELHIRTPEGVLFSYRLAGPFTRGLAWLVDIAIIVVIQYGLGKLASVIQIANEDIAGGFMAVMFLVLTLGYGAAFEWLWRGQTPGKRLLRLRVMDVNGLRLGFHQVLLRNLLRALDFAPGLYLIGGVACVLTRHAQRLGDLAAGTVVVYTAREREPDLEQLLAGKYNSLRQYPHLVARLRQLVAPQEASLALQALLRREDFEAGSRVALFGELAGHFRGLVKFPPDDLEAVPDEQYVRNVVDVIYRARG